MRFKSRKDAGTKLATALKKYEKAEGTICVGLPRGGVVVAAIVAKTLHLPLDIIVPRKIGAPYQEELAIGAIVEDVLFIDPAIAKAVGAFPDYIEKVVAKEKEEAKRRSSLYRKNRPPPEFSKKTVILIDDGIATGATMHASIDYMKNMQAERIVVAIPVAPLDTLARLKGEVDEMVCLFSSSDFLAVGQFYENFSQIMDREVIELLEH